MYTLTYGQTGRRYMAEIYCRYDVKLYPINQSIWTKCLFVDNLHVLVSCHEIRDPFTNVSICTSFIKWTFCVICFQSPFKIGKNSTICKIEKKLLSTEENIFPSIHLSTKLKNWGSTVMLDQHLNFYIQGGNNYMWVFEYNLGN